MKSTNRRWQNHLRAKGPIGFFLDRLSAHALSSPRQFDEGPFHFPIGDRERDDELTRAYFEVTEAFPYEIYIEVTNRCNLSCKMCARDQMTRPMGVMSDRLFRKIADEIADKQLHAYVHYYGIGEPLLDDGLFDKLAYARRRGVYNTIVFTNGQLLTRGDTCERLARCGVATVGVDLDGFSQETYGRIRVGGQFALAKAGIEKLHETIRRDGSRMRVDVSYQIYPGINESDIDPFVRWCEQNEYEYKLVTMHTWAGLRGDIPTTDIDGLADDHHVERNCPCCALWSGLMIGWDGRVGLCFQDADLREVMGDLNEQTMEAVWRGEHLRKRREHANGVFEGLCKTCDSYAAVQLPGKGSRLYPASLTAAPACACVCDAATPIDAG